MSDDELQMQPLENGIDFLENAIESLGDGSPRGLKYAIIHLQAAAEVLLKVRLMREHWTLVFRESGTAKMGKFKMGDFVSVGLGEAWTA